MDTEIHTVSKTYTRKYTRSPKIHTLNTHGAKYTRIHTDTHGYTQVCVVLHDSVRSSGVKPMDYSWMIHRKYMDNSWIVHGLAMDNPWIVHGYAMDYPRMIHGESVDNP